MLVGSSRRWALMHELRAANEPALPALLRKLALVNLVIIEGYKRERHPKLEVRRAVLGQPLLHPDDPTIVAVASDAPLPEAGIPVVDLDNVEAIADILVQHAAPIAEFLAPLESA